MDRLVTEAEFYEAAVDAAGEDGYSIMGVFHKERRECYAYTVGCIDELVVVGLRPEQAAALLRIVVDRIRLSGPPVDGTERDDVVANAHVGFAACGTRVAGFPLTMARVHRQGDNFRAFQVLWPDEDGRLPWGSEYDRLHFPQPVLGGAA